MRFETQWLFAPRLLALPFEVRAAWCALAMATESVPLSTFIEKLRLDPTHAGHLLGELIKADLVRMDGHVILGPSFVALPAIDIPEVERKPSPLSTFIPGPDDASIFH